jgi:limonene-1,2-epoxide hydrolase
MSQELPDNKLPVGYGPWMDIPAGDYGSTPRYPVMPPLQIQKRRLSGRWMIVGILVALLLVSIPSFFIVSYITRSTPDKTLDTFCSALQQEDYPSAYAQFSTRLHRTISEAAFAAIFSRDKVNACTHGTSNDAGNSVITTVKLVHASKGVNNDVVTLTKDSSDNWKIDDIYRQT